MFANLLRQSLHKLPIVFQEHVLAGKKNPHALTVANTAECAAKQHPIKSCYCTHDAVFVPCQKTLHDSPPTDALQKHHARRDHGASSFILVAARTGCLMGFSGSYYATKDDPRNHTKTPRRKLTVKSIERTLHQAGPQTLIFGFVDSTLLW